MAAVGKPGWRRLLVAMAVSTLVLAAACRGSRDSEEGTMKLSPHELIDLVQHYYPPHDPEKWAAPDPMVYYEHIQSTPQYQAWSAKRDEGHAAMGEWIAFLGRLQAELGDEFQMSDGTSPWDFCYYALVYRKDAPKPAHGVIRTNLVVRVSMVAPVYDMYEFRRRVAMVGPKQDRRENRDESRAYEISRGLGRAADAFARAVEAEYGYQRLGPDVLGIRILHLAVEQQLVNQATLGQALLGDYGW